MDCILRVLTEFSTKSYTYSEFSSKMENLLCECISFGGVCGRGTVEIVEILVHLRRELRLNVQAAHEKQIHSFTFRRFLSVQMAVHTNILPRILTATKTPRKIPNPTLIKVLVEVPREKEIVLSLYQSKCLKT